MNIIVIPAVRHCEGQSPEAIQSCKCGVNAGCSWIATAPAAPRDDGEPGGPRPGWRGF